MVLDGERIQGPDMGLHRVYHPCDCDFSSSVVGKIFRQKENTNEGRLCFCDGCDFGFFDDVVDCTWDTRSALVFGWVLIQVHGHNCFLLCKSLSPIALLATWTYKFLLSQTGFPSEIFYRGVGMWETLYGMVTAYPIVCFIFIPVYFNLGITSVYQYIELRFKSRLVRCLASGTYVFRSILNLGVTVFTPTVALYTIIGVPIWVSLSAITGISIIFNLLGGLKAAINADVIQVLITIFVSAVIIIQSTILAGGVGNVYNENRDSGRLNFFNFTGDMNIRVDTTSAWIGQLFMSLSLFGCQQNFVQRYLSMKSIKDVTKY